MNDWHSGNGWHEVLITEKFIDSSTFDFSTCTGCKDPRCTEDQKKDLGCDQDQDQDQRIRQLLLELENLGVTQEEIDLISNNNIDTIGNDIIGNDTIGNDTIGNNFVGGDNTFSFDTNFVSFDDTNNFVGGDTDFIDDSGVRISNPNDFTIPEPDPFFPIEEPSGPPPLPNFDFSPAFFNTFSTPNFSERTLGFDEQSPSSTDNFVGSSRNSSNISLTNPSPETTSFTLNNIILNNGKPFFSENKINSGSGTGLYRGNLFVTNNSLDDINLLAQDTGLPGFQGTRITAGALDIVNSSDIVVEPIGDPFSTVSGGDVVVNISSKEFDVSDFKDPSLSASQNETLINLLIDGIEIPSENAIIRLNPENPGEIFFSVNPVETKKNSKLFTLKGLTPEIDKPLTTKLRLPITIEQNGEIKNYYISSGQNIFTNDVDFGDDFGPGFPSGPITPFGIDPNNRGNDLTDLIYLIRRSINEDTFLRNDLVFEKRGFDFDLPSSLRQKGPAGRFTILLNRLNLNQVTFDKIKNLPSGKKLLKDIGENNTYNDSLRKKYLVDNVNFNLVDNELTIDDQVFDSRIFSPFTFNESYQKLLRQNEITPKDYADILQVYTDYAKIDELLQFGVQEDKYWKFLTTNFLQRIDETSDNSFSLTSSFIPNSRDVQVLDRNIYSSQERAGFLPIDNPDVSDAEARARNLESILNFYKRNLIGGGDENDFSFPSERGEASDGFRDERQDTVRQTISPNLELLNDPLIVNEIANNPELQQQLLDLQASLGNDELFFNELSGVITGLEKNNLIFLDIKLVKNENGEFEILSEEVDDINDITNDIVFEETLRNTLQQTTNITDDDIEETVSQALTNRQNGEDFVFDQEILDNRSSLTNEFLQEVEDTLRENEINTLEQQFLSSPIEEQISEVQRQIDEIDKIDQSNIDISTIENILKEFDIVAEPDLNVPEILELQTSDNLSNIKKDIETELGKLEPTPENEPRITELESTIPFVQREILDKFKISLENQIEPAPVQASSTDDDDSGVIDIEPPQIQASTPEASFGQQGEVIVEDGNLGPQTPANDDTTDPQDNDTTDNEMTDNDMTDNDTTENFVYYY